MNKEKDLQAIDLKRAARWGFAGRVVMNIYAIIASIGCLYPMIWLVYSSLKTQFEFDVDSFSLPASPTGPASNPPSGSRSEGRVRQGGQARG